MLWFFGPYLAEVFVISRPTIGMTALVFLSRLQREVSSVKERLAAVEAKVDTLIETGQDMTGMEDLPQGVTRYAKSPEFTEQSIPEALRTSHLTGEGIWGKIVILEGRLRYRILEPQMREMELSPGTLGIVVPEIAHEVEAMGKVRFHVEFYR